MSSVAQNIRVVQERIAAAAARAGRAADSVRLVAVTKTVGPARVAEAVAAGVTDLGENFLQEAPAKIPPVSTLTATPVRWHRIGHLQSNKARLSVEAFFLVQTVDNCHLAQELGKQVSKRGKMQPVLIEVNLAGGANRAGVPPGEALALAEQVAAVPGLSLQGFLGMAPFGERAEDARPHFARLRELFEGLPAENRRVLSMGMSGDFEVAVEEGATLVRIGTALFGRRGANG